MVVEVLLQIGEFAFYFVVCVRHPPAFCQLVREQVRQVEVNAVHGGTKLPVSEPGLPRPQR